MEYLPADVQRLVERSTGKHINSGVDFELDDADSLYYQKITDLSQERHLEEMYAEKTSHRQHHYDSQETPYEQ
jgi:hypothetical protein